MSDSCILCHIATDDALQYGVLKRVRGVSAHYFCVLMSTMITQSGKDHEGILGFVEKDIKLVAEKCKSKKCVYCGIQGATIDCFYGNCKNYFHFPCGLEHNCSFKFCDKYETFCDVHNHYPKLNKTLAENMKTMKCVICLEAFEEETESDVLATPCCEIHLVHVNCTKQLAFNAGYFTKCPVCNNKEKFSEGLQYHGVFIPLQDASWEQPRGAYSELTHVDRNCEASHCKCPHGRDFKNNSGFWKLIICNDCGSSGAHKGCIRYHPYLCDTCMIVAHRVLYNDLKSDSKRMKLDL